VLHLDPSVARLTPEERFGLDVLVDQSRVLPTTDTTADVVRVVVSESFALSLDAWSAGSPGVADADGVVTLSRDMLRHVTAVAGAAAEQRSVARDRHDRVPSAEHPLVQRGRERTPVVTETATALRLAVQRAAGRRQCRVLAPWPRKRRWAAALTHDVDVVAGWPAFTALRLVELVRKKQFDLAARVVGAAARAAFDDPTWRGVADVIACEQAAELPSTWFVLCGTPTVGTIRAGDLTYRPESPAARRMLAAIVAAGDEIGLHGSFATMDGGAAVFDAQRRRLDAVSGVALRGVRQHYLRMRPGATQREMAGAGFAYDATFGFADRNGFRLGSADIVPAWDAAAGAPLPLDEVPLVWMDRALSKYQGVEDPEAWIDDALVLADSCRAVNGLWVGLWHCNLTPALGYPGAPAAYARLVTEVAAREAWVTSLSQIVAWRRMRRGVRATQVAPDGRVALDGVPAGTRIQFDGESESSS
jgi:hypothetical protein